MNHNLSRFVPSQVFVCQLAILFALQILVSRTSAAQFVQAPPPIADPSDNRFEGVTEDFTSPALSTSTLRPVQPVFAYTADYDGYTLELLQVQWRFGDPLDLYVIKPKGVKKPPVVLYLYGFPAGTERFQDHSFQGAATKEGFAAVGFVSALTGHRYHDRPMREWFVSELQECLATSAHDVQMILNYLETRGDLDMTRVGMYTQGSGATIGILASAVDPRIKVLDATDPWGAWPAWFASSPFPPKEERANYRTSKFLKKVTPVDPVRWLPKIQAQKFRFQDALFEATTPKAAKVKLRAAVPVGSTVVVYNTPEEFNAVTRSNSELTWIKRELRFLGPSSSSIAAPSKQ